MKTDNTQNSQNAEPHIKDSRSHLNSLLTDIVLFNDLANDFDDPMWDSKILLLNNLKRKAQNLFENAIQLNGGNQIVKVAVVGNFSAGKSSFINSLINEQICPVADASTTSSVTTFSFAHEKAYSYSNGNGFRKNISQEDYDRMIQHGNEETDRGNLNFQVEGPWEFVRDIHLLDTPGFERGEDSLTSSTGGDDEVTEAVIKKEADVLFWLMDINTGSISKSQKDRIIRLKKETNNSIDVYIILNKADQKTISSREKIFEEIKKELNNEISGILLYSSLPTQNKKLTIEDVFPKINNSIRNQSIFKNRNWQINISSTINKREKLIFKYEDCDYNVEFDHNLESSSNGALTTSSEIQKKLKEIGVKNKEFAEKHFYRDFSQYHYERNQIDTITQLLDSTIANLHDVHYHQTVQKFNKDVNTFIKYFIENNLLFINYANLNEQRKEIIVQFKRQFDHDFETFIQKIFQKYNFKFGRIEIESFNISARFTEYLILRNDIKNALNDTLQILLVYLKGCFISYKKTEYEILNNKYISIREKLK